MKKILLNLFLISTILPSESPSTSIIDYTPIHKQAAATIAMQDYLLCFLGSKNVIDGKITVTEFETLCKKKFVDCLNNNSKVKKVILQGQSVAGFIIFYQMKEQSLELWKKNCEATGIPYEEESLLTLMPYLKRTDAECEKFAKIEGLVVDKNCRRQGYARALLKDVEATIKEKWPTIKRIMLDVNDFNEPAQKLYASEGFTQSSFQPLHVRVVHGIQYEKNIE